jgi:hypothetical protein
VSFDLRFIPFALVYCAYALTLLSRIFAISRLVVGMNFLLGQVVAEELPDPKGPRAHAPPLRYVAYCYAGCLAGWGPAYTSNGLAYALNFLQAKHPRVKKTYFYKTNSAKDFDTPCNIVGTLWVFFSLSSCTSARLHSLLLHFVFQFFLSSLSVFFHVFHC